MYCCSGRLTKCGTNLEVSDFLDYWWRQVTKLNIELNMARLNTAPPFYATRPAAIETVHSYMRLGKTMIVSAEQTSHP